MQLGEQIIIDNNKFTIRLLSAKDEASIQDLCVRCSDYSLLIEDRLPEKNAGHEILFELPPNKEIHDKFVYGVYNCDDLLIAVIDLVRNYKDYGEWIIGLLLLDPNVRGNGLGQKIHEYIKTLVSKNQGKRLRIGVVEDNYKAQNFWKKMGYTEIDRVKAKYGFKDHVVIVMSLSLS